MKTYLGGIKILWEEKKYFKKTPCGVLVFFWPSGLSCYFETIVVYAQGAFKWYKKSSRGTKGSVNISFVWQKSVGCLVVNNHANTAMVNHTGSGGKQKRLGFLWTYLSRHIFQHESKWPLTCSAALGSACCFSVLASRAIIWNPFACKGFFVWISSTALWAQLSARLLHEARPGPRQCVPNLQMTCLEAMLAAGSTAGHGTLVFAFHTVILQHCLKKCFQPAIAILTLAAQEGIPASHKRKQIREFVEQVIAGLQLWFWKRTLWNWHLPTSLAIWLVLMQLVAALRIIWTRYMTTTLVPSTTLGLAFFM